MTRLVTAFVNFIYYDLNATQTRGLSV